MQTLNQILSLAVENHLAGRLDVAASIYQAVLEGNPNHADALHLLGLVASETGRHDAAVACIGRAIRLNPTAAVYYGNLGLVLARQGRLDEAIITYRQALAFQPGNAELHSKMASALRMRGRLEEAVAGFRQAAHLAPQSSEAYYQLGNTLHLLGRLEEASESYCAAIRVDPSRAEIHFNLGVTRSLQGRHDEAAEAYRRALRILPDYPEAHNNLGGILQTLGCLEEAVRSYQAALRIRPDYADAHYNLALALQDLDRPEEALSHYDAVLERQASHWEAHNNRGNTLLALGRPRQALESYEAALGLRPDYAEALWNRGVVDLLLGNFERGWEGYEWRHRRADAFRRDFRQPAWDGAPYPGRTLLVYAEQGLGDTIQFCRYLELAKRRGGCLWFESQARLLPLLERLPAIDRLLPQGSGPEAFDLQIPLLSLPRIFGTRLDSVPAPVPYLTVDPACCELWRRRIGHRHKRRIGLVWGGNPNHPSERRRGIPLAEFSTLASVKHAAWFSLQRGPQASELASPPAGLRITNLESEGATIQDTAAILMNLDLLITVDTMTAHLAGALGRPVWVLLSFAPDWRWMLDRSDSPWYPGMRLFRQPRPGDWRPVIEAVAAELSRA